MSFNYVNYSGYSKPSYELISLTNNEVNVKVNFEIDYKERLKELVKAIFSSILLVTLASSTVRNFWVSTWTGKKVVHATLNAGEIDPHHWAVLNKINVQVQQIFHGEKKWTELLNTLPEGFEFAPAYIKNDPQFALLAIKGNPQMIYHVSEDLKTNLDFLKEASTVNPKFLYFFKSPLRKQLSESLPKEIYDSLMTASEMGVRTEDLERVNEFIKEYKHVWLEHLQKSGKPYIYLKKRFLHIPCSLQVFSDGRIWVHSKERIGRGTCKYVKSAYDWHSGQKLVKNIGSWDASMKEEMEIYEKLRGKRGIVPVLGCFSLPTNKAKKTEKDVLIAERYTENLDNENRKWTKRDLDIITLDLLHAIKAYQEADLMDGDFNWGNAMVLCDAQGKAIKAGLIDFGCAEIISEQDARDPNPKNQKYRAYQMQTDVCTMLHNLYINNNLESPFDKHKHLGRFDYQFPGTYRTKNEGQQIEYKVEPYTPVDVALLFPYLEAEIKSS